MSGVWACQCHIIQKAFVNHQAKVVQILPVSNSQGASLLSLVGYHAQGHQAAKCYDWSWS